MERYQCEDVEIIFDRTGRDDWGKFSFPVWYGIPVKINWRAYEFDFNLRGSLKRLAGHGDVWPDPRDMLKRTEGNDFIYYGTDDGYDAGYDLIKNYYVPYNGHSDCELFTNKPLNDRHVEQALEAFDALIGRARCLADSAPGHRSREFLQQVAAQDRNRLRADGQTLHDIIGGCLTVLPPDTIDVDYEVIPLMLTEGCSYNCRFCRFKTAGSFRLRSWENIAGQVRALKKFYGADLVNYNSLVLGQNNALAAGEEILTAAAELAYDVLNLATSYHRGRPNLFLFGSADSFLDAQDSLFDRLNDLPYQAFINVGLESPDQETLDLIGKPLQAEKVRSAWRKMQEINLGYDHLTISCNFILGQDLPPRHVHAIQALLSGEGKSRGKGVVYLSPLLGAANRRQIMKEFREIKINSPLDVFLYLAQRL